MPDLFEASGVEIEPSLEASSDASAGDADAPLADRLRPQTLSEVVGQDHLLGSDGPIGRMAASGRLGSMILWGPPGVGKTTIARLLAREVDCAFQQLSAVFTGVADLKKAFEAARRRRAEGVTTLLFVDEIHRFNRAQQDGFLPYVEAGVVTLVGATTENPSFELNGALLSRAQVYVLRRLDETAMEQLLVRAEVFVGRVLPLTPPAREALIAMADGDGRFVLGLAETLFQSDLGEERLDPAALAGRLQRRSLAYDKDREEHYNLISALHKSIRGSDPDAALYWVARMLEGGEDPLFVARRLIRAAMEDVGAADPSALTLAIAAKDAYDFLGSPEGELALAQTVLHLAAAPKSNAVYVAFKAARKAARETGSLAPPAHIRNAPTRLMRDLGYGAGYAYDHDQDDSFSGQNYWPEGMDPQRFYAPRGDGDEAAVKARLARWAELRDHAQGGALIVPPSSIASRRPVVLTAADVARVRAMVVHEDASVLALNKPAGLSSQGGHGAFTSLDDLLHAFARPNGKRPQLVHRLDRDTSGIILAAKTQPAASALGRALMARRVTKLYLAIVAAAPEPHDGVVDLPLRREMIGREAYSRACEHEHPDAQAALSRYRTRASSSRGALLELRPETGRMHQLRVHLAAIGRPLAGDARYGGALVLGAAPVTRLMLHAAGIEFPHPDGGRMRLTADPPFDFVDLASKLELGTGLGLAA